MSFTYFIASYATLTYNFYKTLLVSRKIGQLLSRGIDETELFTVGCMPPKVRCTFGSETRHADEPARDCRSPMHLISNRRDAIGRHDSSKA
jgi:hypothetical protein